MKRGPRGVNTKRRTTVTLPAGALKEAERIARSRNITLSAVLAEGLDRVIHDQSDTQRAADVVASYRRAFRGLSDEQMMILDGIILEPKKRR
jgi:hypothetical protein